jgi:membrane-bound inhibitor of C-type lysozyme
MTSSRLIRQPLITVSLLSAIVGCSPIYPDKAANADEKPVPGTDIQTFVYECPDGYSFVARTQNDQVWLFLPGETVDLPRVTSASGVKYAAGNITFWSKGDDALVETADTSHTGCKNNRARAIWEHAKLNGVDFRATGNEPGWHLEISNQRDILLVTDYGQTTYQFKSAILKSEPHARSAVYNARNQQASVEIVITAAPCHDSMSGEAFSSTVSILVNGKRLEGCGRPLH